jgi:hypothetical protein
MVVVKTDVELRKKESIVCYLNKWMIVEKKRELQCNFD